ncbi:Glycosyltransferases, probably involved in cell wall biogenesis [Clostridium cavendishii DSM 21758]|uniref:Glycosyltransferases, probably involved in cell wall biogenesis n=1 Tax=Clostridium cavendishii DSM 21758 TaxID=1121302 RepID=A0A1M6IX37_9CLOT|nr:glycosyltransferase [Clostridium cavendishii]SHJ38993.1 Glycosyltransferases, probably involved in cell wall biogenesis [Clostridium cavendishii DSM 21758]
MNYKYNASIVIPTYNRADLLKLTLDSIVCQNVKYEEYEVIIIDDGSTDNTVEILNDYYNKINLKYIFQENKGYRAATARNKGITMSEGEIIIFVDCGILLAKNAISRAITNHKVNENCAILGYVYGFDEFNENKNYIESLNIDPFDTDKYIEILNKNKIFDLREEMYREFGEDLNKWPAPWVIYWVGFSSIKKQTLLNVGMFDESFNTWGYEDIDLGISLFKSNVKIILDKGFKSIHYPHEKFKSSMNDEDLKKYVLTNKKKVFDKHKLEEIKIWMTDGRKVVNRILLDSLKTNNVESMDSKEVEIMKVEESIKMMKCSGTKVNYFIFKEFEIHLNSIPAKSVQDWHKHSRIEECIVVTNGEININWIDKGKIIKETVKEKSVIRVKNSIHLIENSTNKIAEFIVFRMVSKDEDNREIIKNDKISFEDLIEKF